jgi:hypothetical protein
MPASVTPAGMAFPAPAGTRRRGAIRSALARFSISYREASAVSSDAK